MSLLRHIRQCNAHDPARFVPFIHGGERLGLIRKVNAEALRRFPTAYEVSDAGVTLVVDGSFDDLSALIEETTEHLVAEGLVAKWRYEFFAAAPRWGAAAHFKIDRGAVPFFGVPAYGVHLNGYRREGEQLKLWVGRRSPTKAVAPNKLDNLVAGGIDYKHGLLETLIKESQEEASLPEALASKAIPVGAVSYRMSVTHGLRDDVLFCYDLELPRDFTPKNTDGELVAFTLEDAREVIARARDSDDFKFNVNLVLIDFALRHGLIPPDDPEYLDLVTGLRRKID
jgi:8-oxo-dGTP pyrophosphatase MutT (NUDIX family)